MSERAESSQRRRRRAPEREVPIPARARASRTNARQRVTGPSNANPIPADESSFTQWTKVFDPEADHLIRHIHDESVAANIVCVGSPKFCCDMYRVAALKNARVRACIDGTKWNWICSVRQRKHDQKLVVALIERWQPSTHTFHLPFLELGFTPFDFVCLTGIPVGDGGYPPFKIDRWKSAKAVETFFPTVEGGDLNTSGVKCRFLREVLEGLDLPDVVDASH